VARIVYHRMDQLYQGKMYFPGKEGETEAEPAHTIHRLSLTSLFYLPDKGIFPMNCEPSFGSKCISSKMPSSKVSREPGVAVHVCNPSIQELEAGRSLGRGQPGLHSETLS
jgi:hypothetical protein